MGRKCFEWARRFRSNLRSHLFGPVLAATVVTPKSMDSLHFVHAADLHLDSPFRGVGAASDQIAAVCLDSDTSFGHCAHEGSTLPIQISLRAESYETGDQTIADGYR